MFRIFWIFTASILLVSVGMSPAHAAKDSVYCKDSGRIYHARSKRGHVICAAPLIFGEACFTGSPSRIIEMINNGAFIWDQHWLEGASHMGRNDITYHWIDGRHDIRRTIIMNPCATGFFRK